MSDNSGQKQDTKFKKGQSGNPAGRPPGSVSIMGRIKKIFEEDPERFESYVKEVLDDPMLRKEVIQQIDGKPTESVEISGKNGGPLAIQVISFDDYDSIQPEAEQS